MSKQPLLNERRETKLFSSGVIKKKFPTEIIRMNFPQRVLVFNHFFCWNENVTTVGLNGGATASDDRQTKGLIPGAD